jgi:hypothetical protein
VCGPLAREWKVPFWRILDESSDCPRRAPASSISASRYNSLLPAIHTLPATNRSEHATAYQSPVFWPEAALALRVSSFVLCRIFPISLVHFRLEPSVADVDRRGVKIPVLARDQSVTHNPEIPSGSLLRL